MGAAFAMGEGAATRARQDAGVLRKRSGPRITAASAALLAIGCVALLLIVATTFQLAERAQVDLKRSISSRAISTAAVQLRYGLQAAESSQRGYIASGNEVYLAPYSTGKALADQQLHNLLNLLGPEQSSSPATLRLMILVGEKFDEMDSIIALKRARLDDEALAVLHSNRGKALMDEANVFLSSIIRNADAALSENALQQKDGLLRLRGIILAAAALILLVVGATLAMIVPFARYLGRTRDEVASLNAGLERRVEERTSELTVARDRAELLLAEVNHRVANSLALVASMVGLQSRAASSEETRLALTETRSRISAVALVHKELYVSGDIHSIALEGFLSGLLQHLEVSMRDAGHKALLKPNIAPVTMPTDKSVSVGVIATEWVTNAYKYAYPDGAGEIRVSLRHDGEGLIELRVDDDGVGRQAHPKPQGTGLGTKLVNAMAASLGGRIEYVDAKPGTSARLILPES